jgi:hypothetical protein
MLAAEKWGLVLQDDVLLTFTQQTTGISWQVYVDLCCASAKQLFFHEKPKMQVELEPATLSNLQFTHQELLDSV